MKTDGVVVDYAIRGAMAIVFWTEPVLTYDLDVFVHLPGASGVLVSLDSIDRWAEERGFPADSEHLLVHGVPVQFIPAHNALADEAIRPEHLIALYLEPSARTAKRLERVAALLEGSQIDRRRLDGILHRYNLTLP